MKGRVMVMSKYTTQLRFICESSLQNKGIDITELSVDDIIEQSIPYVINFTFPIFDESYRNVLLSNIIRHFYTREIGAETVGRWQLFMNSRMNLIMPKYNLLYSSETYKLDPLSNSIETEKYKRDNLGNSEITSNNTTNRNASIHSDSLYSDTPQGKLSGLDYATSLTEDTNNNQETSNATSNDTQTTTNVETYIRQRTGLSGSSVSNLLKEFEQNFKSIDMMICNELNDLFMLIW